METRSCQLRKLQFIYLLTCNSISINPNKMLPLSTLKFFMHNNIDQKRQMFLFFGEFPKHQKIFFNQNFLVLIYKDR